VAFGGTLIWTGGFNGTTAQPALDTGLVDLIAFGRPFIANPDLVARVKNRWPLEPLQARQPILGHGRSNIRTKVDDTIRIVLYPALSHFGSLDRHPSIISVGVP
jgi:NADH:flavin oxidoreductase / NADH oxidase family